LDFELSAGRISFFRIFERNPNWLRSVSGSVGRGQPTHIGPALFEDDGNKRLWGTELVFSFSPLVNRIERKELKDQRDAGPVLKNTMMEIAGSQQVISLPNFPKEF
jgi:hypothetical protein